MRKLELTIAPGTTVTTEVSIEAMICIKTVSQRYDEDGDPEGAPFISVLHLGKDDAKEIAHFILRS